MIEIRVGLKPVPASRPRVSRNGGVFYPKNHSVYYQALKDFFGSEGVPELRADPSTKYSVELDFVIPAMKTSKHPIPRVDIDNLSKLPIDAMTKSEKYWIDDHQITLWVARKRFCEPGEEAHTNIIVRILDG